MSKSDVFHLGLTKNDLQGATLAIVPGDPDRVEKIAALMDKPVKLASHREFTTWRAELDGKPVIVCSTGIGGVPANVSCRANRFRSFNQRSRTFEISDSREFQRCEVQARAIQTDRRRGNQDITHINMRLNSARCTDTQEGANAQLCQLFNSNRGRRAADTGRADDNRFTIQLCTPGSEFAAFAPW